jgi:FkbM family methyltransferase
LAIKTISICGDLVVFEGLSREDRYFDGLKDGMDWQLTAFCDQYIPEDAVILDIGANIGVTSAILSKKAPKGTVRAFEPGHRIFSILSRNIERNSLKNVTAHNIALSDAPGTLRFLENSAYGHLAQDGDSEGVHTVSVSTIDDYVSQNDFARLDFIKIDVEGYEMPVLQGAAQTIRRFNPIFYVEFNSWAMIANGETNPLKFAKWLASRFSTMRIVTTSPSDITCALPGSIDDFVYANMAAHGCVQDIVLSNKALTAKPGRA